MIHGNTVGSRESLSIRQQAILVGKILGDGCLEKNGNHVRLKIEQADSQKEYVFWTFAEFQRMVGKPPHAILHKGIGNKTTKRWRFSTNSLAVFDRYYSLFYFEGKKFIPLKYR